MSLGNKLRSLFSLKKDESAEIIEKIWIFREPRLKDSALKDISFTPKDQTTPIAVANLSSSGIALFRGNQTEGLNLGSQITGSLKIAEDIIEITSTVIRKDDLVFGCSFLTRTSTLDRILRKYFRIEIAAMKMTPTDPDQLAASTEGTPHCFNGDLGNKLYFIEKDGVVSYFELSFLENYIEGNRGKALKIKKTIGERSRTDLKYKAASGQQEKTSPDTTEDMKASAIRFLNHMELLEPAYRTELTRALQSELWT